MISDRDPTPVRSYLAELAGVEDPDAFPGVRVRRINPETWLLETEVP